VLLIIDLEKIWSVFRYFILRTAFASYASKRNPVTRQKGIHANIDRSNAKANTPKYGNVIPVVMHADRT